MTTPIYADNAATTRLDPAVLEAMMPFLQDDYGNASGLYRAGRRARKAVENARQTIASVFHAAPSEIFFTSGGTESDNWALKGTLHKLAAKGKRHLITDVIEHPAVLRSADALEKEGFSVTRLPVDHLGRVNPADVQNALREDTALVSVMTANNEVGTLQPIRAIGTLCRQAGVLFHTDAVQAAGILPLPVDTLPIDMFSLSAHKFHGPKGIGLLYARRSFIPASFLDGGKQENNHRAGTENTAAIVGMAKALQLAEAHRDEQAARMRSIRDFLAEELKKIPGAHRNGDPVDCLPGILNFSFESIDGESLLFALDLAGLAASSGSACTSASIEPSHVLLAMGVPYAIAHGSLRLSLSKYNTMEEAAEIVRIIRNAVEDQRGVR